MDDYRIRHQAIYVGAVLWLYCTQEVAMPQQLEFGRVRHLETAATLSDRESIANGRGTEAQQQLSSEVTRFLSIYYGTKLG